MNEIVLLKPESLTQIVQAAPQSYADNRLSHDRCVQAGQTLLDSIRAAGGMNDELDRQAAAFIEKTKRTLKVMNDRRSPVTRLFDEVRSAFTLFENEIDPAKKGSVSYELQQLRNAYAAKKHKEEEDRRREQLLRQQREQRLQKLRQDIEDDLKTQYDSYAKSVISELESLDSSITLENYDRISARLRDFPKELPQAWLESLRTCVMAPFGVSVQDMSGIETEVKERLVRQFREEYAFEVGGTQSYICDRLPSKKANLEAIAKASEEEAARMKAQMEARQKSDAQRMENERKACAEEESRKTEAEKKAAEICSLFESQAAMAAATSSNAKVTKKIVLLNPEGIMPVISLWWSREGCRMDTESLARMFKKQITFCEKLANKEGEFIRNESVEYIDEVKAR